MKDKAISLTGFSHILKRLARKVAAVEAKADANTGGSAPYDDTEVKGRLDKLETNALAGAQLEKRVKTLEDAGYATLEYTEATYLKKADFKPTTKELEQLINTQLSEIDTLKSQLGTLSQNVNTISGNVNTLTNDVKDLKEKSKEQPKQEEQPATKTANITAAETMTIPASFYTVPNGQPWSETLSHIPKTISVTMDDGSVQEMEVVWNESSYDASKEGEQLIEGTIVETDAVKNTKGIKAFCKITVGEKAANDELWAYDFQVPQGEYNINVRSIHPGLKLTDEDIYGDNLDGKNPRVKIFMVTDTGSGRVETEMPYNRRDWPNAPAPDSTMRNGAFWYDSELDNNNGQICFERGSDYPMNYVLRKVR